MVLGLLLTVARRTASGKKRAVTLSGSCVCQLSLKRLNCALIVPLLAGAHCMERAATLEAKTGPIARRVAAPAASISAGLGMIVLVHLEFPPHTGVRQSHIRGITYGAKCPQRGGKRTLWRRYCDDRSCLDLRESLTVEKGSAALTDYLGKTEQSRSTSHRRLRAILAGKKAVKGSLA